MTWKWLGCQKLTCIWLRFSMNDSHPIISAAWLREHLNDPQVVIVDCRFSLNEPDLGKRQYRTSHIPGAYYLHLNEDLSSPVGRHGGRHPLPNPNSFADKLAAMGVTKESWVVAYDDSRLAFAARLWWLLRYLGHDRAGVLDGSFSGWQAVGYPVADEVPLPQSGAVFPWRVRGEWVVDIDTVKARKDLPGVVLIDSRDRDRYEGLREPIDPVAGHIPGAVNYPWKQVTDESGFVRPVTEQCSRWAAIASDCEAIVYCGSGVTACANLLSLELAGIQGGKLYAGSWSDWCSYLENY